MKALVDLLKQQPPVQEGSLIAGYRMDLAESAAQLLTFSPGLADRFLKDAEPLMQSPDVTVAPEFQVKLVRGFQGTDRAKATTLAEKIKDPLLQGEAWLALARTAASKAP